MVQSFKTLFVAALAIAPIFALPTPPVPQELSARMLGTGADGQPHQLAASQVQQRSIENAPEIDARFWPYKTDDSTHASDAAQSQPHDNGGDHGGHGAPPAESLLPHEHHALPFPYDAKQPESIHPHDEKHAASPPPLTQEPSRVRYHKDGGGHTETYHHPDGTRINRIVRGTSVKYEIMPSKVDHSHGFPTAIHHPPPPYGIPTAIHGPPAPYGFQTAIHHPPPPYGFQTAIHHPPPQYGFPPAQHFRREGAGDLLTRHFDGYGPSMTRRSPEEGYRLSRRASGPPDELD